MASEKVLEAHRKYLEAGARYNEILDKHNAMVRETNRVAEEKERASKLLFDLKKEWAHLRDNECHAVMLTTAQIELLLRGLRDGIPGNPPGLGETINLLRGIVNQE